MFYKLFLSIYKLNKKVYNIKCLRCDVGEIID